jgi:hypothetical protein
MYLKGAGMERVLIRKDRQLIVYFVAEVLLISLLIVPWEKDRVVDPVMPQQIEALVL